MRYHSPIPVSPLCACSQTPAGNDIQLIPIHPLLTQILCSLRLAPPRTAPLRTASHRFAPLRSFPRCDSFSSRPTKLPRVPRGRQLSTTTTISEDAKGKLDTMGPPPRGANSSSSSSSRVGGGPAAVRLAHLRRVLGRAVGRPTKAAAKGAAATATATRRVEHKPSSTAVGGKMPTLMGTSGARHERTHPKTPFHRSLAGRTQDVRRTRNTSKSTRPSRRTWWQCCCNVHNVVFST